MSTSLVMASKGKKRLFEKLPGKEKIVTRAAKRMCSFSSSWLSEEFKVENNNKTRIYQGSALSGKDGDEKAYCKQCKTSFSVTHGGAYDVRRHFKSAGHNKAIESTNKTARLEACGFGESRLAKAAREKQEEQKLQVLSAETQFIQFVAEHNLSFRCGDHFTKLVKSMFPDSDIAKHFQCSRTKTMVLVKNGNSQFCQDELLSTLTDLHSTFSPVFYSLLIDESNDRGVEAKDLVVLARFFDHRVMKAVTRFIALPTANDGTATAIFAKLDGCLRDCGLSYDNLLAFNSDTCNTMKGQRNGVVKYLKDKQPSLVDFGCICHLENLAVKAAMKTLPANIDSFLVDINTHFYMSVKRKEEFKSFCDFVNINYKTILSHVETRWLSLLRVISRVLELWPALTSYFHSHADAEKPGRVGAIKKQLCDKTKLYLLFLNFLLPTINAFNVAFQATTHTTIHQLHPEIIGLTKRILRCFVKIECISTADITATLYDVRSNQVENADIEIGQDARVLAVEMEEDGQFREIKAFLDHVRLFYEAFICKLMKKFPFKSTLLSDLRVLYPKERTTLSDFPNIIVRLAHHFPQLGLGEKLDALRIEAIDFQMANLPTSSDDNVDEFWASVHNIRTVDTDQLVYGTLLVLIRALLALPASNADSERSFSMVRKIDTEDRSHLERTTVASLLALKINIDSECFSFKPPKALLLKNKSAVRSYNEEHGSYQ